ncbi:MAG TPA: glycosyltransferase family 2 protein [Candidatus Angelobacter sp.]|jgi:rhamnosyltransferase
MVIYNPDSTLEQNIRALLNEVARLVVVDNCSEPSVRSRIAALAATCSFEVIWNKENIGLAAGLNTGIRLALANEQYQWIATFDQDSRVFPGFGTAMLSAQAACPFREKVAMIAPHHLLTSEDDDETTTQDGELFQEITVALQSGSLFSRSALKDVGLFDEAFFIDYVDFEFCLRLRKHGFRLIEATEAPIYHRVGTPTQHSFLGITCTVFNHSPLRRYYAARNRLRVYRRYAFSDPRWICHDIWSWFKEIVKMVLFESNRLEKLVFAARGGWDALRGRGGAYS